MRTAFFAVVMLVVAACGKVKTEGDQPDAAADPCAEPGAVCECTAASEDADCGAHSYCDVTATSRTCACVAGYTDGVSGCVWTGTVQDPGFAGTAWTPARGALLNPTAAGGVDPGEVSYVASALCGLGSVKQVVEMPTFAKAEPLVLELSYKNQIDFQNFDSLPMGVSLDGGWTSLPAFNDAMFHTTRLCLGEGGYAPAGTTGRGSMVPIELGPYDKPRGCPNSTVTNFAIDHAAIIPANAGECGAMPGVGPNNDAEGTGGWTFAVSGASSGNFATGTGASATRAARLVLGQRCDSASMSHQISVPRIANPALDMAIAVSNNGAFGTITIGASGFAFQAPSMPLPPPGAAGTFHACLPPSLIGQVANMTFSLSGGSGACADALNYSVAVDNVKVVDDPTCATTANVAMPGFENSGQVFGGFVSSHYAVPGPDGVVKIGSAVGQSHNGTRYLEVDSFANCSGQGMRTLVTVPPANGANGPVLKFFARTGVNAGAPTTATAGGQSVTVAQGNGYQPYKLCLNPLYIGRPMTVTLGTSASVAGTCGAANNQNAQFDDLEVTTDASCPAM